MTKTVLVPDGEKLYAFFSIYCLKKACRHLRIIVCTDKFHSALPYAKCISKCYRLTKEGTGKLHYDKLIRIIREERVDLLMPCTSEGIELTLKHRDRLDKECTIMALPNLAAFHLVSDKWEMYKTLRDSNIATPPTRLYQNANQFKNLNYPVLIKPARGESGVHIRKLDHFPDPSVIESLDRIGEDFIIQDYIDGKDIDCSVLASEGKILAHTIQVNLGAKAKFVPGNDKIKFVHEDRLLETIRKTCELLCWTGVAHIDLRHDREQDRYHLLDFNPRFWGSILGSYAVGVNFPHLLYRLTNREPFESPDFEEKYFVSFRHYLKDARRGCLDYGISETNLKFLLADPIFALRKFMGWK